MGEAPNVETLSPAELTDLIFQLQAIENAVRARKLAAIAAYDTRQLWKTDGSTSMPAWLSGMLGFGRDTAHEEVRVSHALERLPSLHEAFADGSLSWDQARAVSEFATAETDEHLTAEARKFSAAQLRRIAKRYKPLSRETAAAAVRDRSLDMWWELEHNQLRFTGSLPAAEGALFEKTIGRLVRRVMDDGPRPEGGFDYGRLRADALSEIVSAHADADADADRATVAVHVDAAAVGGGVGMAELEEGTPISLETARRLACDSRWYVVVDGPDGTPLGIGRTSRQIPAPLAREIRHRDGGCRFPGCSRRGWTDIHHLVPWGKGGRTDHHNLLTLCRTHHRLVHECGWSISGDPNGEIAFIGPTGLTFTQGPPALRPDLRERVEVLARAP